MNQFDTFGYKHPCMTIQALILISLSSLLNILDSTFMVLKLEH